MAHNICAKRIKAPVKATVIDINKEGKDPVLVVSPNDSSAPAIVPMSRGRDLPYPPEVTDQIDLVRGRDGGIDHFLFRSSSRRVPKAARRRHERRGGDQKLIPHRRPPGQRRTS